jgi:hypothetical protein
MKGKMIRRSIEEQTKLQPRNKSPSIVSKQNPWQSNKRTKSERRKWKERRIKQIKEKAMVRIII